MGLKDKCKLKMIDKEMWTEAFYLLRPEDGKGSGDDSVDAEDGEGSGGVTEDGEASVDGFTGEDTGEDEHEDES